MTYRNKGLRGFLALLMAALMVLGMCGFGYAADALEDVEVDETILIDEPTDTDYAEADEPDEDDVEVVTQNAEDDNKLTIKVVFDIDESAIPEGSTIKFALTQADDSNKVTYISVQKSSDGYWISEATWLPNKIHFISATVVPTIEGYNYSGWVATNYTNKDDNDQLQEGLAVINEDGKIHGLGNYEKVLTIKLKYDKIPTGTLTLNITSFDGVDEEDIPNEGTIKFNLANKNEPTQPNVEISITCENGKWINERQPVPCSQELASPGVYTITNNGLEIEGYTYIGWRFTRGSYGDAEWSSEDIISLNNKKDIYIGNGIETKTEIVLMYKKQFTVNYMLVENGKETTYDIGSFSDGDSITLPPLPKVDGCTVIGWFIGEEEESASEPTEGSGEVPPADADYAEKSVVEEDNYALSLPQYGTLVKPGTTIPATKNMTLYAYAVKAGTPVTYSAYLRINKVDEEGNPVAGAGFTMTNGQTSQGSAGRTDEQGQLLIGMLDVGEFTITETTVPEGYMAGAPVTVNVTAANTRDNPCVVTIVNTKVAGQPTASPTGEPTGEPTASPTDAPSGEPTASPTGAPSGEPTVSPTGKPTSEPTVSPTDKPSGEPTVSPTDKPTARPTAAPTDEADGEEVPKTGDNGLGYLYALMGLSGLGIAAMLLMLRKLRRS